MSENIVKRPTIAELEKILNTAEEGEIEILPDGQVRRLSAAELMQKERRHAFEEIQVLRADGAKLRDALKRIVKQLDDLLP